MTIIAVHGNTMVADSVSWCDDVCFPVPPGREKVLHTSDGGLVGAAGASQDIALLHKWVVDGMDFAMPPAFVNKDAENAQDYSLGWLWLTSDGRLHLGDQHMRVIRIPKPYAIGMASAVHMWLGAVLGGMDAERALRLAISRCAYVGGEPQVEHLASWLQTQ